MGRTTAQELEAENQLLRAQLEAIKEQVADLLDELDEVDQDRDGDDRESEK